MNDDDQIQMKSNIFEYLGAVSFFCTILLTAFSKLVFRVLFTEEYMAGYIIAPYLFFAPLMLMLYQVVANQFTIIKKTYLNLIALASGAILNIVLNFALIPQIGIEGASVATIMGYEVSLAICLIILLKIKRIRVNKKIYINTFIFLGYFVIWRLFVHKNIVISIIVGIVISVYYIISYRSLLKGWIQRKRKAE